MILRRAARFGKLIGFEKPFLAGDKPPRSSSRWAHYTDLRAKQGFIQQAITDEKALPAHAHNRPQHPRRTHAATARRGHKRHPRRPPFHLWDTLRLSAGLGAMSPANRASWTRPASTSPLPNKRSAAVPRQESRPQTSPSTARCSQTCSVKASSARKACSTASTKIWPDRHRRRRHPGRRRARAGGPRRRRG